MTVTLVIIAALLLVSTLVPGINTPGRGAGGHQFTSDTTTHCRYTRYTMWRLLLVVGVAAAQEYDQGSVVSVGEWVTVGDSTQQDWDPYTQASG